MRFDRALHYAAKVTRARRYREDLFPKQRAFFDDPAKIKAAVCSRRAGKTWAACAGLYEACLDVPGSTSVYIALTGKSARNILWPVIRAFNERYGLGMALNDNQLIATCPNGSRILLTGADQVKKIEALRGQAYRRAVIDEAQAFTKALLRYLLDDVLEACMLDLDGDIWLNGTPNAACAGQFHDLTTGKNPKVAPIPTHSWTVLDNTFMPHASSWLASIRQKHKWTEDNPVYKREYLALWARDASSLVFRFDRARHCRPCATFPELEQMIGGADIGTADNERTTALVRGGWAKRNRTAYCTSAKKYAALNPSSMGDEMVKSPAGLWVLDEGGLGKGYGDEFRKRQGADGKFLNVKAAEKLKKSAFIEHCNGELDGDRIVFADGQCDDLIEELELLQWDEDEDHKAYDPSFADHAADAFLYWWREIFSWAEKTPDAAAPLHGSPEWAPAELEKMKRAAIAKANQRDRTKMAQYAANPMLWVQENRAKW